MKLSLFTKVASMLVWSILVITVPLLFTIRAAVLSYINTSLLERLEISSNAMEEHIHDSIMLVNTFLGQASRRADFAEAMASGDHGRITALAREMDRQSDVDFLTVSDRSGNVIVRTHSERKGDSILSQANVRKSLAGEPISVDVESGSEVQFSIRGGVPIMHDGRIQGVLTAGMRLDTQELVDTLKTKYGMEVTLFKDDIRVSTTLKDDRGNRLTGTRLNNPEIVRTVLEESKTYVDEDITLGGNSYSVIYKPFTNLSGKPIGMIFLGISAEAKDTLLGSIMSRILLVGITVAVLMGVMGVIVARAIISRPLARVTDLVRDLVDDKAELSLRLDTSRGDELAKLSHQVNRLTAKLDGMLSNIAGYENVVNSLPDPVFVVDREFKLLLVNDKVVEIAGAASAEDLIGRHVNEALGTAHWDVNGCALREVMGAERRVVSELFPLRDGESERSYRGVCEVVRNHNGETFGYLLLATDVTDLVEKESELSHQMDIMGAVNEQVTIIAQSVKDSSEAIRGQTMSIQAAAENQSRVLAETLISIQQMSDTVGDIARSAAQASSQAENGQMRAHEGEAIMRESVDALESVKETAFRLHRNLSALGGQAEGIGQVMNVISDIADQTNLLALNAAIEAARAGDAGRGFAVVADEVRKLAEKTMNATHEVRTAVTNIQQGASDNIGSMEAVTKAIANAVALSQSSEESLSSIVGLVNESTAQIASIAAAAEEQSAASEQIARSADEVSKLAESTVKLTEESVRSVEELADLAEKLNITVR